MTDSTLFDRFLEPGRATAPVRRHDDHKRAEMLTFLRERYPSGAVVADLPDIDLNFNSDTSDAVRDFISTRLSPEGPTS
jgi:hypothetical protein